jgi:lipopolysaccharide cholinephosphotransferase
MPSLREIQLFELKMLKDVAKVCEENDIQYFLSSGTLLGAVRHGGFIPWDDDIDVYMPLPDYRKFLKIGQKLLDESYGNIYFVQNYRTEKNYHEMWTQIRTNNTTSMPVSCKKYDIHFGMCLDIFPLVGCSNDLKKQEKQKKALQLNRLLLADKYIIAVNQPMTWKMKVLYTIPRSIRRWICKLNERRFMLDLDSHDYAVTVWYKIPAVYPKDVFSKTIRIKFEDDEFDTMIEYDQYLTILYGDYMKLPDEKDRGTHELTLGNIIVDLENDYTTYR